jgi:hypothetical protein
MSFAAELAAEIVARGLGAYPPTGGLVFGELPFAPDVAIAIYERPGTTGIRVHDEIGERYLRQRAQLSVRGVPNDPAGPSARALALSRALGAVANQPLSGTRYLAIDADPPFFDRRDENDRYTYVVNLLATKEPS